MGQVEVDRFGSEVNILGSGRDIGSGRGQYIWVR